MKQTFKQKEACERPVQWTNKKVSTYISMKFHNKDKYILKSSLRGKESSSIKKWESLLEDFSLAIQILEEEK